MKVIPKQLIIEATSYCNLKCRYCPSLTAKSEHMSLDLFKSIVDRIDFPTTVVPWMNGEPFLNPNYLEMIKYLDEAGHRYYITTNGTIENKELLDYLTREGSGCYQIIVSLDGLPFSRSVKLARPGTDEDKVIHTISYLSKLETKTDIAVKICRRGQDWEEIEKYISYWLRFGLDFVIVGDQLTEDENPVGFRSSPCQYPDNNFMVIRANGKVVMCAYNDKAANDDAFSFGSVDNEMPLLDVYNNKAFNSLRINQKQDIYNKPCNTCGFAYTGQGFTGEITLRDNHLLKEKIYYSKDYYNQFFSLKKKRKKNSYYKQGFSGKVKYE